MNAIYEMNWVFRLSVGRIVICVFNRVQLCLPGASDSVDYYARYDVRHYSK